MSSRDQAKKRQAKKRARRTKAELADAPRYPSGRLKHTQGTQGGRPRKGPPPEKVPFEESPVQSVLQARARQRGIKHTGPITKAQAAQWHLWAGTQVALWLAQDKLTQPQANALQDFAILRAKYRAVKGMPPEAAQGAAYGQVRGSGGEPPEETILAVSEAYSASLRALTNCGSGVLNSVLRLTVDDLQAPLHHIRIGADALEAVK